MTLAPAFGEITMSFRIRHQKLLNEWIILEEVKHFCSKFHCHTLKEQYFVNMHPPIGDPST